MFIKKLAKPILTLVALVTLAFPVMADKVYLFAGDRIATPARPASIHRYTIDSKTSSTATAAPAAGLAGGLWGGTGDKNYQGLEFAGIALAPNGDFYAVSPSAKKLFRIDGKTGAYKKVVLSDLKGPDGLVIDAKGNIYIADVDRILRCSSEGAPLPGAEQLGNIFTRGGAINTASGMAIGPDGNLYVSNQNWRRIEYYDGGTGEYLGLFHLGGISNPAGLAFGPDGNLYVACVGGPGFNAESGSVVKLDGKTGEFISKFAPQAKGALGLAFGPNGNLYVSHYWSGKVSEFDAKTGALVGVTLENSPGTAFYGLVFAVESANGTLKQYASKVTAGGKTQ